MLIKNFLKLCSYANRSRNRLLYFSTNSFLQLQNKTFPSIKPKIKQLNESYYLNYLRSKMDYYNAVYDVESLYVKNHNDPEAIKLLLDFDNNENFPEKENLFNEVLKYVQNELSNYRVDEFCKIIALTFNHKFLPQFGNQIYSIRCCIDQELNKRYFSKSENLKVLFTLSSVYGGNFRTSLYFHYKAILKLLEKIDSLSVQEIVQTFYCIPARDFSKIESKFFILSYLNDIISLFNSDELGIIAKGLVRGNMTFSHENIYVSILNKTRNEMKNIHPVPFISVCKVLLKFMKISDVDNFKDFQEKMIPYLSKLDKKCLISLVYAGDKYKILNSSLEEIIIKKWKECIMDCTYSEIVRIIYMTVAYNIQDEELLLQAMNNLETVPNKYENLVSALNNLSFHRLYSKKLLDEVFSENFFNEVCSKKFTIKEKADWWSLYCNVKLEKPEYCNDAFNSSFLNAVYKKSKISETLYPSFKYDRFYPSLNAIEKILKEIYGESKVFVTDVVPHFSKGIVLRFNKNSQAQEIPENFCSSEAWCFKKSLEDDHLWIFVLLLNYRDFLWGTNTLSLRKKAQCRQLKVLGYEILMVKLSEFLGALKQNSEKAYIANLMDDCLRKISFQ